jgi:hypothetical protein
MATTTITITKEINNTEFFDAITGSDFYGCTDFVVPRTLDYNEDTQIITLQYLDVDNLDENGYYKELPCVLNIEQLLNAYATLLKNNQTHCYGHRLDHEDYDGCFAYLVLQQAIYGQINF